ncbi:wall-associated receptor kinase-like 14 [Musa acuminata AAA Group]|uniref:wall-associated receptor kinase-like 14 n=1 Tax=Musa acuminata AAA Group TaxID=214697 RepID=UPI0031D06658
MTYKARHRLPPLGYASFGCSMMTHSSHQTHAAFLFFALSLLCVATGADGCNRTCGSGPAVPYPFGFSAGCPIRLNCSQDGARFLGEFRVRNITTDAMHLDVPPVCDRFIHRATAGLFGANYAMTASNALFLRNCTSKTGSECSISTDIIAKRMKLTSCGPKDDDISCYSSGRTDGFLSDANFTAAATNCRLLYTSVRYGEDASSDQPSLVFGSAEIGWWLNGECRCAANATCKRVDVPVDPQSSSKKGFRCSCHEGFIGDGFAEGERCRRDAASISSIPGGKAGAIVGGAVAGAALALGLALLCYLVRRRGIVSEVEESGTRRLLYETSCTVAVYSHKEVERATGNFSDAYKLGAGAYATVYMGRFSNTGLVAIKRLKHPDTDNIEHVINEIKLVSSVSHPNLVHLLGCCIDSGEHILVYEFMPNGTLSQHLHRERGNGLSWSARVSIATETARAIAYLHTAVHPPIYHRDIKSSNILLDYDLRPKLADFGLSRVGIVESSHISTAPQGTPGYVDPQYHQNFHLSDKSDVYSYGVVLVEMITAMKVVDFRRAASEVNLASLAADKIGKGLVEDIVDLIIKENWNGQTRASVQKVAELAFRCLAFHRDARPSMAEVAEELEKIMMEECSPAQPEGSEEQHGEPQSRRSAAESVVVEKPQAVSPVSVQDQWTSERSSSPCSSSSVASSRNLNRGI